MAPSPLLCLNWDEQDDVDEGAGKGTVHYWKDKREVDFIAQKEGRTLAINVCYEDSIPERETEGLKGLKDSGLRSDDLFLVTRDTDKELDHIRFVPLWQWLLSRDFF